jgi:multidrug resistance efflux pump
MDNSLHSHGPTATLADRVRSLRLSPETVHKGQRRAARLPWLLCVLLSVTCAYLGYRAFVLTPTAAPPEEAKGATQVTAGTAAAPSGLSAPAGRVALEAGGYVIPVKKFQVSPKVGGQITALFIEEGMAVKKDQVIAKIDRSEYEFEYQRTKALVEQAQAKVKEMEKNRPEEVERARAALDEAKAQLAQLQDEAHRARQGGPGTTAEELVRVESRLSAARFRVQQLEQEYKMMRDGQRQERKDQAKGELEHANAQFAKAEYNLNNCDVLAPVDGIILTKLAEVGDTVLPNVPSNGLSASICKMADLRDLEVDVDVSERDLDRITKGQECEIRTEAFPGKVYAGKVSRLMPEANRSKASVSVRVHIDIPPGDDILRPEMRARVTFLNKGASKEKAGAGPADKSPSRAGESPAGRK